MNAERRTPRKGIRPYWQVHLGKRASRRLMYHAFPCPRRFNSRRTGRQKPSLPPPVRPYPPSSAPPDRPPRTLNLFDRVFSQCPEARACPPVAAPPDDSHLASGTPAVRYHADSSWHDNDGTFVLSGVHFKCCAQGQPSCNL